MGFKLSQAIEDGDVEVKKNDVHGEMVFNIRSSDDGDIELQADENIYGLSRDEAVRLGVALIASAARHDG